MVNTDEHSLLMMEPILDVDGEVNDEVVAKLQSVWHLKERTMVLGGVHECICGVLSDSTQWMLYGMETNSLAFHYLIHHRYEVPEEEIAKVMALPEPDAKLYAKRNKARQKEIVQRILADFKAKRGVFVVE